MTNEEKMEALRKELEETYNRISIIRQEIHDIENADEKFLIGIAREYDEDYNDVLVIHLLGSTVYMDDEGSRNAWVGYMNSNPNSIRNYSIVEIDKWAYRDLQQLAYISWMIDDLYFNFSFLGSALNNKITDLRSSMHSDDLYDNYFDRFLKDHGDCCLGECGSFNRYESFSFDHYII